MCARQAEGRREGPNATRRHGGGHSRRQGSWTGTRPSPPQRRPGGGCSEAGSLPRQHILGKPETQLPTLAGPRMGSRLEGGSRPVGSQCLPGCLTTKLSDRGEDRTAARQGGRPASDSVHMLPCDGRRARGPAARCGPGCGQHGVGVPRHLAMRRTRGRPLGKRL